MKIHAFQIYGDNLGECHKFCGLLVRYEQETNLVFQGYFGPKDRPIYLFKNGELNIGLLACGRYEDWNQDRRPFVGYEDPDIIVCHAQESNKAGKPILGLEFNDAIEAGNNAWQRLPRIAQAAEKGVAFIYSIPVCDAELKDGKIKSLRHPNAIIQLAQLILMAENKTISLTTFTDNPWYKKALQQNKVCPTLAWEEGERNLANISSLLIIESLQGGLDLKHLSRETSLESSFERTMINMLRHVSYFIQSDCTVLKDHPAFEESNFLDVTKAWWRNITGKCEIDARYRFYEWKKKDFEEMGLPFQKVTSTRSVFESKLNRAIDAISYKKGPNEVAIVLNPAEFSNQLTKSYPSLEKEVLAHISESQDPVLFLPIAGYVMDTGGPAFSRPDKGLVGLMRVIFGRGQFSRRVVLLYSDLVPGGWKDQVSAAKKESTDIKSRETNNLWREIIKLATALIIDKYGSGVLI